MKLAGKWVPVVLLVAAGVVALLLARDVAHRQASFASDDARFRSTPGARLWSPSQIVPLGAASTLLGVEDDLTYRRALQVLRLAQPHRLVFSSPEVIALRGEAQLQLTDVARRDPDAARRSAAENFLGGLSFAAAALDDSLRVTLLQSAIDSFRAAVADDESNADAKYNLELALASLRSAESAINREPDVGNASAGRGAGVGRAGSGY